MPSGAGWARGYTECSKQMGAFLKAVVFFITAERTCEKRAKVCPSRAVEFLCIGTSLRVCTDMVFYLKNLTYADSGARDQMRSTRMRRCGVLMAWSFRQM